MFTKKIKIKKNDFLLYIKKTQAENNPSLQLYYLNPETVYNDYSFASDFIHLMKGVGPDVYQALIYCLRPCDELVICPAYRCQFSGEKCESISPE